MQTVNEVKKGSFSGSVRTNNANYLPAGYIEADFESMASLEGFEPTPRCLEVMSSNFRDFYDF